MPISSAAARVRATGKGSAVITAPSSRPPARVTQSLPKPRIGHLLNGQWRVVRELAKGKGGMGIAFEVTDAIRGSDGANSRVSKLVELRNANAHDGADLKSHKTTLSAVASLLRPLVPSPPPP